MCSNLDLSMFENARLIQFCLGEYQLQLLFHPKGSISIESHWVLRDHEDTEVDRAMPNAERVACRLHRLLGRRATQTRVEVPDSFSLTFDNGDVLEVFVKSDGFESFSIQPGDVFV